MIAILASAILGAIIGMFITAHALPAVKGIVRSWVWLYSAPAPKQEREGRRAEVGSHIFEFTHSGREAGDATGDIAVGLFERWMKGLPSDIAWCAPFIPALLADKIAGWSDALMHYKASAAMVSCVATLVPMNYFLFNSPHRQAMGTWLFANGMVIAIIILVWNIKHPLIRRIFYLWIGIGVAVMTGFVGWLAIHLHLYTLPWFQVYSLGFLAVAPVMQVVDKPWRTGLPSGQRFLFTVCWGGVVAVSMAGSQILMGSLMPLASLWVVMVAFAVMLLLLNVALVFGAWFLCLLGIRGSAGGLRLVASGIRRLL